LSRQGLGPALKVVATLLSSNLMSQPTERINARAETRTQTRIISRGWGASTPWVDSMMNTQEV
jgi:hypothetical protein